jgi:hypothetical protein
MKKKEPTWDKIGKDIGTKIEKESKEGKCKPWGGHVHHGCGSGGAFYGLGFIGAAVYYISAATGFWNGVLGVLKALVWPAFVVYGLLSFIGM